MTVSTMGNAMNFRWWLVALSFCVLTFPLTASAQDEAGTPFCVTYDFDSEDDGQVTIRERDAMTQTRVPLEGVAVWLRERLEP